MSCKRASSARLQEDPSFDGAIGDQNLIDENLWR
jgi:hypothetical protein